MQAASYVMLICRKIVAHFQIESNIHVQEASRNPSTSHQSEVHGPPSTPGIDYYANAPFSLRFQQVVLFCPRMTSNHSYLPL